LFKIGKSLAAAPRRKEQIREHSLLSESYDFQPKGISSKFLDAFLTSLGQLRHRLPLAEAGVADPNGDGEDAAFLREEAQRLIRNWREGVRPVAERVILDGSWHTSPGSRLRWHVREMCKTGEVARP
jgi:hypothetical protein